MRIGIDATFVGTAQPTGLEIYTLNVVNELAKLHDDIVIWTSKDIGFQLDPERVRQVLRRFSFLGQNLFALRPFWMELVFPQLLRRSRADILLSTVPGGMRFNPVPHVVVVHDLTPITCPGEAPASVRWNFEHRLPGILSRAAAVVAVSRATRNDIVERYAVAAEKVQVVYEGYDRDNFVPGCDPAVLNRFHLREKNYILAVGSANPRKNLGRLVDAFGAVQGMVPHDLALAGPFSESEKTALRQRAARHGCSERVRFLGYVAYRELPQLYSGAALVAYLSLYEGFGLPVLEAMACGAPVLASATTSIPEVAGDAALLVDPLDGAAIASALTRLLEDRLLLGELASKGIKRAQMFSWHQAAGELLAIMKSHC